MSDDRALRDRLSNLAAAVPVRPSSPTAMVRRPVHLGPAFRPASGRSWVLVALVATLLVAAVGILGSGSQPAYGPVVETVRQGAFELTLRADKGRYAPGEPVEIKASLTYRGPDDGVQIGHASGARQSPLGFGIQESVVGDLRLGPGWDEMCVLTQLTANTPLEQAFQKSAGWAGSNPRAAEYQAWVEDPELRLDRGAWHVFAVAEFSIGDCGPAEYQLRAQIAITVESAEPSSPIATDEPSTTEVTNPAQSVTVREGNFELTIRSGKTRYTTDEAVDVTASLVYRGAEAAVDIWVGNGLGQIYSRERSGEFVVGPLAMIMPCYRRTFEQGVLHEVPIVTARQTADGFEPQPVPRLPPGTWHLYAGAYTCAPGLEPEEIELSMEAEITIVVSDDPGATPNTTPNVGPIPSLVPTDDPTNTPVSNVDSADGFQLTLAAPHGRYRSGDPIEAEILLENVGHAEAQFVLASSPLVALTAAEANGKLRASFDSNPGCEPFGYYQLGEPTLLEFRMLSNYGVDVSTEWLRRFVEGPTFTLPSGTWTLTARAVLFPAECGEAVSDPRSPIELEAEITVIVEANSVPSPSFVAPPGWVEIPLATMESPTLRDGTQVCPMAAGGGVLAQDDRTGLGVTDASGDYRKAVVWHAGYSAWLVDGQAVLVDPEGEIVAREGDTVAYAGGLLPDGKYFACSEISRVAPGN